MRKLLSMSSFFSLKNNGRKGLLKRIFISFMAILSLCFTVINPIAIKTTESKLCSCASAFEFPDIKKGLKKLFKKTDKKPVLNDKISVYLGGHPLGFTFKCDGVLVVAVSNESAVNLNEGDIIKKIEQYEVSSVENISEILNNNLDSEKTLKLSIIRNNEEKEASIKPIYDNVIKKYKLGIWIRDDAAGVGTLTYVRRDTMRFGALGHPVCDIDTGVIMPVSEGEIYKCNIVGYRKGVKGKPGELKGLFLRSGSIYGVLDKNRGSGVYGMFNSEMIENINKDVVEVADRREVKSGKALIRCTIEGYETHDYEIEIVKVYFQTERDTKSMFIRVTDELLLERTGGIVQGMSGSPIIQNGKLIGAVTHVFVSDPTKGYGIFADIMINE